MVHNTDIILKKKLFSTWKLNTKQKNFLDKEGYCLIEPSDNLSNWIGVDENYIRNIIDKLLKYEGLSAGAEGKEKFTIKKKKKLEEGADRLGNLLNKHIIFSKIATIPILLHAAYHILSDDIKLSSILFREPKKNFGEQEIHIDWHPRRKNSDKFKSVVCFYFLEDSKKENGATIIIPKTHKKLGYPCEHINPFKKNSYEKIVEAKAGSLLILNANTWHKGGENKVGKKRGMIAIEYRQRQLKQLLNLKKYVCDDMQKKFLDYEKYLFGLRENDICQNEDSYGPGEEYRNWLKKNEKYNFQKNS